MANLYEDAGWSEKYLEEAIKEARKQVTKNKICCFSLDCLKYYYNDLMERVKEGRNTSFIDLWGLVIESMLHDKVLLLFFFFLIWLASIMTEEKKINLGMTLLILELHY